MMIFGIALSLGLGLQLEPDALQHLPDTAKVLMTSGLLPAAVIAIVLNLLLPDQNADAKRAPREQEQVVVWFWTIHEILWTILEM